MEEFKMALIPCKHCGKDVSDRAKVCPHCGGSLTEEVLEENKPALICEECGAEIPEGADSCPVCGCPLPEKEEPVSPAEPEVQKVEIAKVSFSQSDNTKKLLKKIALIVVALIAVIAIGLGIHSSNVKAEEERIRTEYYDNLVDATSKMFSGAVQAEETAGLIHDVWYNCIYEEHDADTDKYTMRNSYSFYDDFNDALANLFSDSVFLSQQLTIKSNQDSVSSAMKALKNPPDEYRDAYDDIKNLYDAYLAITECAINPSGNLSSYTSGFNQADSDFIKYYKVMKSYFE